MFWSKNSWNMKTTITSQTEMTLLLSNWHKTWPSINSLDQLVSSKQSTLKINEQLQLVGVRNRKAFWSNHWQFRTSSQGYTEYGHPGSDVLQKVGLVVLSNQKCVNDDGENQIYDSQICAGKNFFCYSKNNLKKKILQVVQMKEWTRAVEVFCCLISKFHKN